MNVAVKTSKDTILMSTLLAAALLTMGAAGIHSNESSRASNIALMVVKTATLIADARVLIFSTDNVSIVPTSRI